MSSNSDNGSRERPPLKNPETKEKIREARDELAGKRAAEAPPDVSEEEAEEARRTLAREPAPDPDNPRPDLQVTAEVEFRGHPFEFTELGDSELEATKFSDIEEGDVERGTEAAQYVYQTLGRHGVGTDEDYWRQYSMQPVNGEDGVMELFNRLIGAFNEDVDLDEMNAAGN